MWGNVLTEVNTQTNFNVGFTNMKSDVLIHLTQWQYWWWFWFSFLWSFYYLVILKIVRFRTLKFRPRIATSLKPHGKWGDLIVCVIPVSWCANILTNSNLLLRMIEWQTETGMLTIRIRGKQWYWVYKYEIKTMTDVFTLPKNVGRDKWQISTPNDITIADSYLHAIQLRSNNEWVKNFWTSKIEEGNKYDNISVDNFDLINYKKNKNFNEFNVNKFSDYNEISRWNKRSYGHKSTLRVIKYPVSNKTNFNYNSKVIELFSLRFNKNNELSVVDKDRPNYLYFVLKQKRYSRLKVIKPYAKPIRDPENNGLRLNTKPELMVWKRKYHQYIYNNDLLLKNNFDQNLRYKYFKVMKNRYENANLILNKRILRVNRTVVLPAHVNLTAITNSFDVIHSWFIPGLGLKMDCVPGRATHHTFYIDNVGFYYGQCAEICGRYHHHMPIRICALPYEHFLIWWNFFGVKKFMRGKSFFKKHRLHVGNRKYVF